MTKHARKRGQEKNSSGSGSNTSSGGSSGGGGSGATQPARSASGVQAAAEPKAVPAPINGSGGGAKRQGGGASKNPSAKQQQGQGQEEEAHLGKNKRPDLIGTRPCERYLNGHCNFGKDCWFVHEGEPRVDTAVKSALPTPQPPTSPDRNPPKPKISLAPTNPWGKVKIPPAEEASPDQETPRSPVVSAGSPQSGGIAAAPPPPLARPMPMPVMSGTATSQPGGLASPPQSSSPAAVSNAKWDGGDALRGLNPGHLSEPLNDMHQLSQRDLVGGPTAARQQQFNDQAQRESQMRQQLASQQVSQPLQPGSQPQPGQQPPQSQQMPGQQAMYRMPPGAQQMPQMGGMGMGGGMPQMAFMGGAGVSQQQQQQAYLQAQAQAQAAQARAQAQAHAQAQAQAHAQAQHAAQQQAQKQRAQQIAQMQQAQAAANARHMQARQLAQQQGFPQSNSREVSPATGAPQHHHLQQQTGGELSMEGMSAALPGGMSDFGRVSGVESSPPIGPSLGMGSAGMQQRPSLDQSAGGQFADMSQISAGGSALGSGLLGQQRPGAAGGSAAASAFAQQQQWNMFGPTDGGDALSGGGLGLGGARQPRDEGMFGAMTDVFSNARMGLYETHDPVDQVPQGDPFGSGDYGGFNMYQGGLGGSEWMPPSDESGAATGMEDSMGDPVPRYQHF